MLPLHCCLAPLSFGRIHCLRTVDIPMMMKYGSYPRYRLLVTYFIEKKGWSVDQLLQTRLTEDEATEIMRADAKR